MENIQKKTAVASHMYMLDHPQSELAKENKDDDVKLVQNLSEWMTSSAFVEKLTTETLKAAVASGVEMYQATISKKTSLYIPLGWYCVEKSLPDHPIICGARKCYMTCETFDVELYLVIKQMFAKSGRVITRMEEIARAMQGSSAAPEGAGGGGAPSGAQ